jgi:hypothetical protein
VSDLEGPMDDDAWLAMEDADDGGGATDWVASRFGYGDNDVPVEEDQ